MVKNHQIRTGCATPEGERSDYMPIYCGRKSVSEYCLGSYAPMVDALYANESVVPIDEVTTIRMSRVGFRSVDL